MASASRKSDKLFISVQVSTCWSFEMYGNAMLGAMMNDPELKGRIEGEVVVGTRSDRGGYGYVFAASSKDKIGDKASETICWWNEANSHRLRNAKGFKVGDHWKQIGIQTVKPELLKMLT